MVGLVTLIALNLEVNQVLVRSGKGKTNLVQLRKNLGKGKKRPSADSQSQSSPWKAFSVRAMYGAVSHSLRSLLKCHFLITQYKIIPPHPHTPLILPICLSCFILPHSTCLIDYILPNFFLSFETHWNVMVTGKTSTVSLLLYHGCNRIIQIAERYQ